MNLSVFYLVNLFDNGHFETPLGLLEIVLMVFIIVDLELFTKFRVTGEVVKQTKTENRRSYSIKPMAILWKWLLFSWRASFSLLISLNPC